MATSIIGRIVQFGKIETGQGKNGEWSKQSVVIEYGDQYTKKAAFTAWGNIIGDLERYSIGDRLEFHFSPESREYNGKWYTDNKVYKIALPDQPQASPRQQQTPDPATTPRQAMAQQPLTFDEGDGDLPF